MAYIDNDHWRGICTLYDSAIYEYTVEAWADIFRGWQREFVAKFEAGASTLTSEALEGAALLKAASQRAHDRTDSVRLLQLSRQIGTADNAEIKAIAESGELDVLMATYPDRSSATQYAPPPRVIVDRPAAHMAAWYEFFPRIDDAKAMGFNVIYLPPIHPIGRTNRKGRNNAIVSQPGDPGVPWAIG